MKKFTAFLLTYALACMTLAGCAAKEQPISQSDANAVQNQGTAIVLSDEGITVDGEAISTDETAAVYAANDIVYYEEGKDFTYGEGTEADAHSQAEADAHTVVHITEPGTYVLSGSLSAGQVAVDLGEDAEEDPGAVVSLVLNDVDIFCSVAPAIIFYEVYECGSDDADTATKDVDTTAAGANVLIADGTVNNIYGSYVARIYKPDSVELSEDGTEVVDSKKLHKYDAAFYSKKSMNVGAWGEGTGVLNINAENEGLDAELHLTINGGNINITSGNDGINTNEDYVSVTTINGGNININVTGSTGEGDGIDSNGWLVINGGTVVSAACGFSGDAGIDSEMGIHVKGGTVMARGNMYDRLEEGSQNYAVFTFASTQAGGSTYTLKNAAGEAVAECTPANDFMYLIVSSPDLAAGEYTFWQGQTQLGTAGAGMGGGMMGGQRPIMTGGEKPEEMGKFDPAQMPEGMEKPEGAERPEGGRGERGEFTRNEDGTVTLPDGTTMDPGQLPQGGNKGNGGGFGGRGGFQGSFNSGEGAELSATFTIVDGANFFSSVAALG